MKNLRSLLTLAVIAALTFTACQKDRSEDAPPPNTNYSQTDASSVSTGLEFMPEAEYNRLPVADPSTMQRLLPGDATSDRGSYKLLATPPVGNQGVEGSCTAWATAYCVSSYYMRAFNKDWSYSTTQALRSPEFLFNATKSSNNCSGAYMSTVLNYMQSTGVCSWSQMPYTDAGCATLPNTTQKSQAAIAKLASWQTVTKTVTAVKNLLDLGYPTLLAFDVNTNFKNQTFNAPYLYKSYNNSGNAGGHVVAIVGYDDANQRLIVQNSWGTGYHDKGFFYIAYSLFPTIAKELYVANPVFPTFTVRHASAVGDVTFNVNGKDYVIKKGQTLSVPAFLNTNSYFMWECLWQNNAWACNWDGDYKPVYGKKYKIIDMSQNWDMKLVAE